MNVNTAHSLEPTPHTVQREQTTDALREVRVIRIEPTDALESVLLALRLHSEPVVLLLPEKQSQAFSDPAHFAQLREVCTPKNVSFLIPQSRMGTVARYAHRYGFAFASSLEKASHLLVAHEKEQARAAQEEGTPMTTALGENAEQGRQRDGDTPEEHEHQVLSPEAKSAPPSAPLSPERTPSALVRPARKHSISRRVALVTTLVALLVVAGATLVPVLFSAQPKLMETAPGTASSTSVGQIAFTSSGQLDPTNSKGLNDTIVVSLHDLAMPARGQSYYGWLIPNSADDTTRPLLLGKLSVAGGTAQLTYMHPNHKNLLADYSSFEVVEQPGDRPSATPPLDPAALRYVGSIPNTPTPGDERHYSLLNHIQHLLAKDQTLQHIGLQGGLDMWLYRNAEKLLEWSSAARDNWAGGKQTALIHRHMIRVLDYLDGAAYVSSSGDVPLNAPLLVDPQAGRIGLLEVSPTQALPAYLTHVDIHLQGLTNAPGHTEAQRQLAIKIDNALRTDTALLQRVRQDAIELVRMSETHLKSTEALTLLNDMVTNANAAYTGQFGPATGGTSNGIVWIHNALQGIATISVTTASENRQ